jgi:hypothetical protein
MVNQGIFHSVQEIEHHDIVSSGIIGDQFHDQCPRESTKHALITSEEPVKAYMVEVIAESHY